MTENGDLGVILYVRDEFVGAPRNDQVDVLVKGKKGRDDVPRFE